MPPVMPRYLHSLAAGALLALLFSACQMEMGIGAKLNGDGSGTFTMAIAVDKEFIDGIAEANRQTGGSAGISGIGGFEDFFDSLKSKGWRVKESKTSAGDVAFSGQCDFTNTAGFDRCVQQVGSADGGGAGFRFGNTGLTFDFGTKRSFFKTHTFFAGTANLTGPPDAQGRQMTQSIQALADQYFSFDIRAELSGSIRIVKGGGSVTKGIATWHPRVGESLDFRAEADAINPLSLLVIALPLIGLFGFGAWGLVRKRTAGDGGFVRPEEPADAAHEEIPVTAESDPSP